MWIATINERPDEQCVQDTAAEAVREALTWYNEQEAPNDNGEGALTLEVCRYERVDLPDIGRRVPDLIIDAWENSASEGAPDLMFLEAARDELARRVDALVLQWSDECNTRPDWYEQSGKPLLVVELAWGEDEEGYPCAVVSDEVWAKIEELDASANWLLELHGTCADDQPDEPPQDTPERALEALRLAHPQQGWALVSGAILGAVRPFGASIVVTRGESGGWLAAISWAGQTVGAEDADPVAAYRAALVKREARDAA